MRVRAEGIPERHLAGQPSQCCEHVESCQPRLPTSSNSPPCADDALVSAHANCLLTECLSDTTMAAGARFIILVARKTLGDSWVQVVLGRLGRPQLSALLQEMLVTMGHFGGGVSGGFSGTRSARYALSSGSCPAARLYVVRTAGSLHVDVPRRYSRVWTHLTSPRKTPLRVLQR